MLRLLICVFFGWLLCRTEIIAEDRIAKLDKLVVEWQQQHDAAESLKKELNQLTDKFQDLRKKYQSLDNQIESHQKQIQQAQAQKKANDKKKGNNKASDQKLDQQIREDQRQIDALKKSQAPVSKEAKEVELAGKGVEKRLADKYQDLWSWRNAWAAAADIDLSASRREHSEALQSLGKKKGSGPLADAWDLAQAIAQAGAGNYDTALTTLEPLVKKDVWAAKASSLRAYVYCLQGQESKSLSEFSRAVKLDNRDPHYYLLRGIMNVQFGKYSDARNVFEAAEKFGQKNAVVSRWQSLAYSLELHPSPAESKNALELAQQAVKQTNQADWAALDALAAAQAAGGDFPAAAKTQQSAAKLAPQEQQAGCEARRADYAAGKRASYNWKLEIGK